MHDRKYWSTLTPSSGKTIQPEKQSSYTVGKLILLAIHRHIKVHTLCVK